MAKSKIEWTDRVWNPVTGCTPISEGCDNCYAERMSKRLAGRCGYPEKEPFKVTMHKNRLEEPLRWKKPSKVFICSMGDLFHEDVPESWISAVFLVMQRAKRHTFMVLTKRPERMANFMDRWSHCDNDYPEQAGLLEVGSSAGKPGGYGHYRREDKKRPPLPNVWLGVTAENQRMADIRIPILLQIPAAVRFVSIEPMLGLVSLKKYLGIVSGCQRHCPHTKSMCRLHSWECEEAHDNINGLDWVICGGESGSGARPMHTDWARSLRDQCQASGVPFMFKQWGEWYPDTKGLYLNENGVAATGVIFGDTFIHRVGKKRAGRLLDGQIWNEFPKGEPSCKT